jgi:hypothetical protein
MRRTKRGFGMLLWALLALLLVAVLGGWVSGIPAIGPHVSRNSEGYVVALLLAPVIDRVHRRGSSSLSWSATALAAGGALAVGVGCLWWSPLSSIGAIHTLNEAFFAAAVLISYVRVARPLPRLAWSLPLVALAIPVLLGWTRLGETLAETYGFCVLVPLGLDWVDRAILEPTRPRSLPRVWAWIATLVAVPTLISVLVARHPSGPAAGVVDYLSRPTEAFVAALLLHAYFSALLPWLERRAGGIPAG